ncbi:MAG: succinyl-diaminopimelate desuccinylase [Candidatus Eisenbacteria bacterium]|uniref:Succinyl-diaminopimelate desuccinylase n=1 Tax=Eiseniibacteriota bacterium TaxID=2212470 RepID=A0A538UCG1_UNCEI|nr:MAG: succinyl-diaminopimelate desuccinylase [Candidatus Eisenbacteria bacterium]
MRWSRASASRPARRRAVVSVIGGPGSGSARRPAAVYRTPPRRWRVAARRCYIPASREEPPMISSDTLADLLETLVNIPSETGHEAAIADWMAARLGALGRGEVQRTGQSLAWRGPRGRAARPLVVLAGHLDTVPANGNATARRDSGRLYGLGSSDMKGGDVVLLALLESLDPARLRFDLAAVFYDAEEGPAAGNGLGRVLRELPWLAEARLAILLEPTDLRVELGCIGTMNAEVRVTGKSAHSARPWLGVNAVARAAPWLAEVTRFPVTPVQVGGVEYRETLQVTTLHAGRARNVVPDELTVNLNYRFPPDRTLDQAEARLKALVPSEFGFAVVDRAAAGQVCADLPEVAEFVQRFGAKVTGKQGWTDVARFTAAGVPAFNFGPGIPEQAHQADEYCPLENLDVAYRWLAQFLSEAAR